MAIIETDDRVNLLVHDIAMQDLERSPGGKRAEVRAVEQLRPSDVYLASFLILSQIASQLGIARVLLGRGDTRHRLEVLEQFGK